MAIASRRTPEPPTAPSAARSSTGEGECGHDYFPSDLGATWELTGTNSVLGAFQNTATVSVSSDDGFVVIDQFHRWVRNLRAGVLLHG